MLGSAGKPVYSAWKMFAANVNDQLHAQLKKGGSGIGWCNFYCDVEISSYKVWNQSLFIDNVKVKDRIMSLRRMHI